jgi:hypothetical protein
MTTLIRVHATGSGQYVGCLLPSCRGWRCFTAADIELPELFPSKDAAVEALNRQQSEAIAA